MAESSKKLRLNPYGPDTIALYSSSGKKALVMKQFLSDEKVEEINLNIERITFT